MNYKEQATKLAGPIALCKYKVTRMLHEVSDDACQIFGGRAITKTGMGRQIETLQRTYKVEEISVVTYLLIGKKKSSLPLSLVAVKR
jgi:alkylation response protein AidB-like acyl-CoA dehydrogenase